MKILQFTSDGVYEKVFATGYKFSFLTTRDDSLLYSSILSTKKVHGYDIATGNLKYGFEITTGTARGLAFDPLGHLHVSTYGNIVEVFTYKGKKIGQKLYPEVSKAEGILIDGNYNIIIAVIDSHEVLVFTRGGALTKKITGFSLPIDVAMGYQCDYLIVSDYGHDYIYLL